MPYPAIKPPKRLPTYVLPLVCLLLACILWLNGCGNLRRDFTLRGGLETSSEETVSKKAKE